MNPQLILNSSCNIAGAVNFNPVHAVCAMDFAYCESGTTYCKFQVKQDESLRFCNQQYQIWQDGIDVSMVLFRW